MEAPAGALETAVSVDARADHYRLLARLLSGPARPELFGTLRATGGDPLGDAFADLHARAAALGDEAVACEHRALFAARPQPRLMPYASFYRNGHLFGRALAELRIDLARMGIARNGDPTEPEDHVANLSMIMAGLIAGRVGSVPVRAQAAFFARHIEPWAPKFLDDLEAAEGADFYAAVARFGRAFLAGEAAIGQNSGP
ncbi:molecular chaperone TorD family protein [Breoghania sp. L-A4]|uniref:TorD/DmsD family molecular chaperone n=1 Tax=Breoghania sp. L-A4 TaxID=2304600 RepID=UPI0013C3451E|nr:molecular chaperone TorD family protein [Breoghania sp. L-A4]